MSSKATNRMFIVISAVALALLAWIVSANAAQLKVGDVLPDLAAYQLEGQLPDSLKGKVVIVDFWASWCSPCKASFPVMEQLYQRYSKDGLVIVAVNIDDKRADMEDFLKKNPVTFTVVRDAGKRLVSEANIPTMPTSFVIDRAGKVRVMHSGFHGDKTRKEYEQQIEEMLKTDTAQTNP